MRVCPTISFLLLILSILLFPFAKVAHVEHINLTLRERHPQYFWAPAKRLECSISRNHLTAGILNALTGFMILTIPIRSALSSKRPKPAILFIFFLGIASLAAGIARTYLLSRPLEVKNKKSDFTWAYHSIWITSALELYLGMVIPPLLLLFIIRQNLRTENPNKDTR